MESTKKAAKKTAVKKTPKTGRAKRKTNLLKLCAEMNKLIVDAVDREVVKYFKIIIDTGDDDITKQSLLAILKEPDTTDAMTYEERLQPYIKHYLFMLKRKANTAAKEKKA
ncbi:MAG: hypothetical protein LBT84_06315 [Spirochaetia bacterium]|jgi:N-acetyl-beta-hexosaminidase|nr:hypothetical protein [Spirochaetia bacterium]